MLNRRIQIEVRRGAGRARHGIHRECAKGRMSHFNSDQLHAIGNQGGWWNVQTSFHFILNHGPQALDEKITKRSPTLGRDAEYSQHSRLERLPTYLTIHMVRFAWKTDAGKKAKIMVRKLQWGSAYSVDLPSLSSAK